MQSRYVRVLGPLPASLLRTLQPAFSIFPPAPTHNMLPQPSTRHGQSQARALSSRPGTQSTTAAGAPPPPSSSSPAFNSFSASSSQLPSSLLPHDSATILAARRTSQLARQISSSAPAASPRRSFTTTAAPRSDSTMSSSYGLRKVAAPHTLEHRVYIEKDGVPVSPFHDIPLYANAEQTVLNMIVEIPRWTNAKLEVSYLAKFSKSEIY